MWRPGESRSSRGRGGAGGGHGGHGGGGNGGHQQSYQTLDRPAFAGADESSGLDVVFNAHARSAISRQRSLLPIFQCRTDLLFAVETHGVVIVLGETGSGKSTQILQYLDESGWTSGGRRVVCTQPRRVAVTSLAKRVAEETGTALGDRVGYSMRLAHVADPQRTRIMFVTAGSLLSEISADPLLSRYSVVMLDEVHERSVETDLLISLLRVIRRSRPELRVVIASATLPREEAKLLQRFFSRDGEEKEKEKEREREEREKKATSRWGAPPEPPAQRLQKLMEYKPASSVLFPVPGRTFPVSVMYLQDPCSDYVR